jgi:hypothetical protein
MGWYGAAAAAAASSMVYHGTEMTELRSKDSWKKITKSAALLALMCGGKKKRRAPLITDVSYPLVTIPS